MSGRLNYERRTPVTSPGLPSNVGKSAPRTRRQSRATEPQKSLLRDVVPLADQRINMRSLSKTRASLIISEMNKQGYSRFI